MSKVFVISDTWFNRPMDNDVNTTIVDYNNKLISAWNEAVSKEDIVYVLGGFGIADLYHIVFRLNGEIHFLDNYFNENEEVFMGELKSSLEKSIDETLKERVIFDLRQVISIPDLDCFLSYFPLTDWPGKNTGTFCFHGINGTVNVHDHNVSATSSEWDGIPVDIEDIENSIKNFSND